jgi:hypothetical protein
VTQNGGVRQANHCVDMVLDPVLHDIASWDYDPVEREAHKANYNMAAVVADHSNFGVHHNDLGIHRIGVSGTYGTGDVDRGNESRNEIDVDDTEIGNDADAEIENVSEIESDADVEIVNVSEIESDAGVGVVNVSESGSDDDAEIVNANANENTTPSHQEGPLNHELSSCLLPCLPPGYP